MQIRGAQSTDLSRLRDIDGTIESSQYLHLERGGEDLAIAWKLDPRPLREKHIDNNPLSDETAFTLKQIVTGTFDGVALSAEHQDALVALAFAQSDPAAKILEVLDLRVDFDMRREGVATAMVFEFIQHARKQELRAVKARTRANNVPAARFFQKLGFELAGMDTHFASNHDLVKEVITLFWYLPLD